jgi:hypothetical protein
MSHIGKLSAVALVAVAGTLVVPQSANADTPPPCYGNTCFGVSPTKRVNGVACADDAKTVATVTLPGTSIEGPELRWSRRCAANWASGQIDGIVYTYKVVTTDGGNASGASDEYPYYTQMVNGQLQAKVCVHYAAANRCSDWK